MKASNIWGKANLIASYLLGNKQNYRKITISCESEQLTLPVTPWRYTVNTSQDNKFVDILDFGEVMLFGNSKLKCLKFGCFFPNQENHEGHKYVVGDSYSPSECIDQITKWKESKKPVRVIITDSPINLVMGIIDFNYFEKDGTRDIWYDIEFKEYKDLNTPPANNDKEISSETGLKSRPTDALMSVLNAVNNQADFVNSRLTNANGGIPINMTGGIQAAFGCFGSLTNQGQSVIKGISKARDLLEVSKSAYGNFKGLGTLQSKNGIAHTAVKTVVTSLGGGAFKL